MSERVHQFKLIIQHQAIIPAKVAGNYNIEIKADTGQIAARNHYIIFNIICQLLRLINANAAFKPLYRQLQNVDNAAAIPGPTLFTSDRFLPDAQSLISSALLIKHSCIPPKS